MSDAPKILVFDSGLGGLTVLREVVRSEPGADFTYVADDAFFPYGQHSEAALIARVVPLLGDLIIAHLPDLIVIACNTASTIVLPHLRAEYQVPFVGTVPAIKPACAKSASKMVSVLGTRGTVAREYTHTLIRNFAGDCHVNLVGSEHLAPLAEAALAGGDISDDDIRNEIMPCFLGKADDPAKRTDTVVLACTHYPLLIARMMRLAPWPVTWLDPAPAIARRAADLLGDRRARQGRGLARLIFTSGKPHPMTASKALAPFFGGRMPA